jgi:prepilin-type N-terminal cleavage/methylation domain-containing protein
MALIAGYCRRRINLCRLDKQRTGFTILELIVVIVILAVIAVISLPGFNTMKESSLNREASANLKLIQAAEKVYKVEMTTYYVATNADGLNTYLRLALPTTGSNWNYKVETTDNTTIFTGKAQRTPPSDSRVFWINQSANDTQPNGTW